MTPVTSMSEPVFRVQPSLTYYCTECPTIKFFVIGHDDLGEWIVTPEDHVAATLAHDTKAVPLEKRHAFAAGK